MADASFLLMDGKGNIYTIQLPEISAGVYGLGRLPVDLATGGGMKVTVQDASGSVSTAQSLEGLGISARALVVDARNHLYDSTDGTSRLDRVNIGYSLLASAARTSTGTGTDQTNYNWSKLIVIVNVTARAAATTLTPSLQVKDSVSGNYFTIWTAAAAINTASGTFSYQFAIGGAAGSHTESVNLALPQMWRLVCTPNDANSLTYSASAQTLR